MLPGTHVLGSLVQFEDRQPKRRTGQRAVWAAGVGDQGLRASPSQEKVLE
jgi:hypothetical protein